MRNDLAMPRQIQNVRISCLSWWPPSIFGLRITLSIGLRWSSKFPGRFGPRALSTSGLQQFQTMLILHPEYGLPHRLRL